MKTVCHSPSLTPVLVGAAIALFYPVYRVVGWLGPGLEETGIGLIASLVVLGVAGVAKHLWPRRNGVTLQFERSSRQNVLHVILHRRLTRLAHLKLRIADYYGQEDWMAVPETRKAIADELRPHRDVLAAADKFHLVGLDEEGCQIVSRLIREVLAAG
ncbi:hypothetical protein [Thiohalorhabdus sp.]|uniref:hypothetical protein n=1 Tax=Thiohalorhabdus sp. TaxID=3094134 RepID=UPI002FC33CA5